MTTSRRSIPIWRKMFQVASRKSQVASGVAFGDVIGYWLLVIGGVFGAVSSTGLRPSSRKSQVVSPSATLLVIGILVYWEHLRRYLSYLISDFSSFIKKIALQSNAYQNSSLLTINSSLKKILLSDNSPVYRILALLWAGMNSRFQNKSVAKQRKPKLLTPHSSLLTFHRESSR